MRRRHRVTSYVQCLFYLFYGLFNDAVSSLDYIASNGTMLVHNKVNGYGRPRYPTIPRPNYRGPVCIDIYIYIYTYIAL